MLAALGARARGCGGREADGEAQPKLLAAVLAGQTCYEDGSVYPYVFRYFVKQVQDQNESAWAMTSLAPTLDNLQPTATVVYLPFIRK